MAALAVVGTVGPALAAADALPATVTPAASVSDVTLAQTDLDGLGYGAGGVDGVDGPKTQGATEWFQSDNCLGVDSVIGPNTLGALRTVVTTVQGKVGVGKTGQYSATTANAVKAYQKAHKLAVNGQAGAATMKAMGITRIHPACNTGSARQQRIVNIAKSQLGTVADGNKCTQGKPYNVCEDWCAAFATWAWRDAGVNIPFMTYVPNVYDWAVSHGKWYGTGQLSKAAPGDLIIFGSANNRYHIGIVDHVRGGTVYVISGNTHDPLTGSVWGAFDKAYSLSGSVFYGLVHL